MDNSAQWENVCRDLMALLQQRKNADAAGSYTASLLQGDENALLKKLVEEAGETALAAKDNNHQALCGEFADLWFHCFIAMTRYNVTLSDVAAVLAQRSGTSGLAEKAARNNSTQ